MQLSNFLLDAGYNYVDVDTCGSDVLRHMLESNDYDFVMMDLNFPGTPEQSNMLPGVWSWFFFVLFFCVFYY
jgi:hypothetical protein